MISLSRYQKLGMREYLVRVMKLAQENDPARALWAFRALENLDRDQFHSLDSVFYKLKREKIEARNKLLAVGALNNKTRIIWDNEIAQLRAWQHAAKGKDQKPKRRS